MRTIDDVIANLAQLSPSPKPPEMSRLHAPVFSGREGEVMGTALAVASMKDHITDEGWQIMKGLQSAGYVLAGHNLSIDQVDVPDILRTCKTNTVVVQDKREWDAKTGDFRDPAARFRRVTALKRRHDLFKLTILKDAHQRQSYHRESADEMGVHAWITYYNPRILCHLAPFLRSEHLVRTYHSIDRGFVPPYTVNREGCLLSGALSAAYPLRQRLVKQVDNLPKTEYLKHPGYNRSGCVTPEFLQTLGYFKVAICTSSIYGYALRKIIEATACGCRVLTDLPVDEVIPEIDSNLVRITPECSIRVIADILQEMVDTYDPDVQAALSRKTRDRFDYRTTGKLLAQDIATLRSQYPCT